MIIFLLLHTAQYLFLYVDVLELPEVLGHYAIDLSNIYNMIQEAYHLCLRIKQMLEGGCLIGLYSELGSCDQKAMEGDELL